jgi:hypothetical protein
MQPWLNVRPGMSMGPYGTHYERTQTWWEESKPWHQYLARCQYLLQQGLWSADICLMSAERAPNNLPMPIGPGRLPPRPGYNFDAAPAEAVLTRFSVRDGKMVLPDGMSYRVLVLPEVRTMTPALLRKIKKLVGDGATVIGPKPLKSPSLSNYPACDAEIKSLADEVWGDCDGTTVREHSYGKGHVIWGKTADEVLKEMKVPPDFTYEDSQDGPSLLYCHHILGDADYYFVANKLDRPVAGTAQFRIANRAPEFWWPETGRIEPVAAYTQANGVTSIPMQIDSNQSVFVVFRTKSTQADPVATVTFNGQTIVPPPRPTPSDAGAEMIARLKLNDAGKLQLEAWKSGAYEIKTASGKERSVTIPALPAPLEITGPWQAAFPLANGDVSFDPLASWSENTRDDVKYFSGTATYDKTFQIPAAMLGAGHRLYLDLGDVEVDAQVTLNGKDLGILWKAPYRVEITDAAQAGDNRLEIKVTNLWPNRLIGDAHYPRDTVRGIEGGAKSWPQWLLEGKPIPPPRQTFTSWELWKKDDPLLPSGLLGPVTLRPSAEIFVP